MCLLLFCVYVVCEYLGKSEGSDQLHFHYQMLLFIPTEQSEEVLSHCV